LLWEKADGEERELIQDLVISWQAPAMKRMGELLAKYDTLGASLEIIHQFLEKARYALGVLPPSNGRTGLRGLTEHLARQTDALGVCA
jgi:geranylgeranyl pyrophosphate synthase